MLALLPARAAEWSLEPSVSLRTEYSDNFLLTPDPHLTVWGLLLSPDLKFSGATESLTVTGRLNLSFNRYVGQPQLNINNHDISLLSSYRPSERDLLGLEVHAVRDSTLSSELATTGVVLGYRPRNAATANTSWSHALTEATSFLAGYNYNDVHYQGTGGTSLTAFADQTARIGFQSNIDESKVARLELFYDRYETRPAQTVQNTYGMRGGYDHQFSETLRGLVTIGWRWTQSTVSSQALVCEGAIVGGVCSGAIGTTVETHRQHGSGVLAQATLEKRFENDSISGEVSQEINPSGLGSVVQTQRVGVAWTRQWSPTLNSTLNAAAYRSAYVGGVVNNSNGRYFSLQSRLQWRLAEECALDLGYSYAWQKQQSLPASVTGNVVYVTVTYTWPRISTSR